VVGLQEPAARAAMLILQLGGKAGVLLCIVEGTKGVGFPVHEKYKQVITFGFS